MPQKPAFPIYQRLPPLVEYPHPYASLCMQAL
jgi:hypothetical protein